MKSYLVSGLVLSAVAVVMWAIATAPVTPVESTATIRAQTFGDAARISVDKHDWPSAIEGFRKALQEDPNNLDNLFNRAVVEQQNGDLKNAMIDYDKYIETITTNSWAYEGRGNANHDLGRRLEAISDYNKAITLNPRRGELYMCRGTSEAALKKYPEAITNFSTAIELMTNRAMLYVARGKSWIRLHDYTNAIADFNSAAKLEPENYSPYLARSEAKFMTKDFQGALDDINKANALKPKARDVEEMRSLILAKISHFP